MIWQLVPWKFLIRRAAEVHGLLDPVSFLARVRSLAQPSEVKEPMELVRANILPVVLSMPGPSSLILTGSGLTGCTGSSVLWTSLLFHEVMP
jgi:hypothetical protein